MMSIFHVVRKKHEFLRVLSLASLRMKLWVEILQYCPYEPFSREQRALNSNLAYDDTLNIIRSENVTISGKNPAALFI